jgi:hypothetical protein
MIASDARTVVGICAIGTVLHTIDDNPNNVLSEPARLAMLADGDITVTMANGSTLQLTGAAADKINPLNLFIKKVHLTGTSLTGSDILLLRP